MVGIIAHTVGVIAAGGNERAERSYDITIGTDAGDPVGYEEGSWGNISPSDYKGVNILAVKANDAANIFDIALEGDLDQSFMGDLSVESESDGFIDLPVSEASFFGTLINGKSGQLWRWDTTGLGLPNDVVWDNTAVGLNRELIIKG